MQCIAQTKTWNEAEASEASLTSRCPNLLRRVTPRSLGSRHKTYEAKASFAFSEPVAKGDVTVLGKEAREQCNEEALKH